MKDLEINRLTEDHKVSEQIEDKAKSQREEYEILLCSKDQEIASQADQIVKLTG